MPRSPLVFATLFVLACLSVSAAVGASSLIPETTAVRHGLTRPWFAQLEMAQERSRIHDIVLDEGVLFVQTDMAVVQAIDAETGKTLWVKQIGRPGYAALTPGANRYVLVVVNGSHLYVVNRKDGRLLLEKQIDGSPGAGIAVSEKRVFMPLVNGMITTYRLDNLVAAAPTAPSLPVAVTDAGETAAAAAGSAAASTAPKAQPSTAAAVPAKPKYNPPLFCQSMGEVMGLPVVTSEDSAEEYLAWCTDRGRMNIGIINRSAESTFSLRYRLDAGSPFVCSPAFLPAEPQQLSSSVVVIAASREGIVYAIRQKDGRPLWRFPTGESIIQTPAVIGNCAYVATQIGGMYCLNARTGENLWWTADAKQVVAASKSRLYVVNQRGDIQILNRDNGITLDVLPAAHVPTKFCNIDTDRLYLADEHGTIQCLHEIDQVQPLVYRSAAVQAAAPKKATGAGHKQPAAKAKTPEKKAAEPKADNAENDPFQ